MTTWRLRRPPKRRTLGAKIGQIDSAGPAARSCQERSRQEVREETMLTNPGHIFALLLAALLATAASTAYDQAMAPTNSLPNPYRSVENWAKLPDGRTWGSTSAVDIDADGSSVWVGERCGAFAPPNQMGQLLAQGKPFACEGSNLDPILKFDASGKLVKSFGAGMLIFPHGIH